MIGTIEISDVLTCFPQNHRCFPDVSSFDPSILPAPTPRCLLTDPIPWDHHSCYLPSRENMFVHQIWQLQYLLKIEEEVMSLFFVVVVDVTEFNFAIFSCQNPFAEHLFLNHVLIHLGGSSSQNKTPWAWMCFLDRICPISKGGAQHLTTLPQTGLIIWVTEKPLLLSIILVVYRDPYNGLL